MESRGGSASTWSGAATRTSSASPGTARWRWRLPCRFGGGILIGRETLSLTGVEEERDAEVVARSVSHAYLSRGIEAVERLPGEVLLPADFADRPLLESILSDRARRRVAVRVPKRGAKVRLVELAVTNARHSLSEQVRKGEIARPHADEVLYELQDRLGLKVVPRLIVCFDISHTQGAEAVASAVLFENGEPCRAAYRHMKIRGGFGNDDFRSMEEAVGRYFGRRLTGDGPLPDLALIDGGAGQLGAARAALSAIGLDQVAVAALAKKREEVYLPERAKGLRLPRTARSLHLLQRVRDEAHRFAVRYNRKLRSRRTVRSELGDIPGIGPRRQQALLSRFGSLRGVKEATAADIGRIPGFSEAMGVKILTYLHARSR